MKKIFSTIILLATAQMAFAQNGDQQTAFTFHGVLLGLVITLSLVLLMVVLTLQKVVNLMQEQASGTQPVYEDDRGFWEKMLSLKPLAAEKEVELEHDYDGIRELNNPIPPWFNVLFYGTIVFGFCYLMVYYVFDAAPLQVKEYENELADAEKLKAEYLKKMGNAIDESNVTLLTEKTKLDAGSVTFASRCAACHGEKGEGKVGPNLTDKFWLHGGSINDIFKTIKYGVPAKGMVAWQNSLNPVQMQEVTSYIMSLQGSNPPGAKEPQGEEYNPAGATAPADSSAAAADTTQKQTADNK